MGQHSDKAREILLDSAEELFATEGVDAVSNRRITEHAGSANHSAIKYHFGGREGLILALLGRGRDDMSRRREELLAGLPEQPSLAEQIAVRILPWVEHLEALPVPSWRARCLQQLGSLPSVRGIIADSVRNNPGLASAFSYGHPELSHVPENLLKARSGVLGGMVVGLCASHEAALERGDAKGSWQAVGYFLIDAATGLLAAPVTHKDDYISPPSDVAFAL